MCGLVGVFLGACAVLRLGQRAVDETVLGVHDGRLGIHARLFHHAGSGVVACRHQPLAVLAAVLALHVTLDEVNHLRVMLQQLQCQIARGVLRAQVLVGLQELLDMRDAVLNLVTVVDVNMSHLRVRAFEDLDDRVQQLPHAASCLERCRHHRHTEERGERFDIQMVAAALQLVVHVQRTHHPQVHIHQLCRQVQVALQV